MVDELDEFFNKFKDSLNRDIYVNIIKMDNDGVSFEEFYSLRKDKDVETYRKQLEIKGKEKCASLSDLPIVCKSHVEADDVNKIVFLNYELFPKDGKPLPRASRVAEFFNNE